MLFVAIECIGNVLEPVVFDHNTPAGQQEFRINLTVIGIIDDPLKGILANFAQGDREGYFCKTIAS